MPWRRARDPYAIWVAEVMLQQTQVATVLPYYDRWMRRFPDIATLARASLDEVLREWEGLGYYARARNLHRAAGILAERHGAALPADSKALAALPGVGSYTLGAILSIAFDQAVPAVDGNVRRVLSRLFGLDASPGPLLDAGCRDKAASLVSAAPAGRCGTLNEALMELGALVCTPRDPACSTCPLAPMCRSRAEGKVAERPRRAAMPASPTLTGAAAIVISDSSAALIIRRPPSGLLGGLWGFPGGFADESEEPEACVRRSVLQQTGVCVEPVSALPVMRHVYTHFKLRLHPFRCMHLKGEARPLACDAIAWAAFADLDNYAMPVTDRRLARYLTI